MNKIKKLKSQLESNQSTQADIEAKLQIEYDKVFDDSAVLRDAIKKAEKSNDYQFNEFGEIESWSRCYDLKDFEDCKEYLETWLNNQGIQVSWENECLLMSQGGCFVINDNGDVYDTETGKFFLKLLDYMNEELEVDEVLRNQLIEKHMEKTGYFPGVFSADRHGNVFPVNTKE